MSRALFLELLCAAALAGWCWLALREGARRIRRRRARGRPRADAGPPRPASPSPLPLAEVPLVCDAVAALVESGMSVEEALAAAGDRDGPAPMLAAVGARLRWGSGWAEAWASAPGCWALERPLRLSSRTGAPAGALLRDAAEQARRRAARDQEAQAAAMTVRLVLPLGLCALPAFVCLGIVPVALALLPWF